MSNAQQSHAYPHTRTHALTCTTLTFTPILTLTSKSRSPQILFFGSNIGWLFAVVGCPGNSAMTPMVYWILRIHLGIFSSVSIELLACVMEGKRVPTFPGCLCRLKKQRALFGLQFTSTLGKALSLLSKHGLEHKRRKEFPVIFFSV